MSEPNPILASGTTIDTTISQAPVGPATDSTGGLMSAADKTKLDSSSSGAAAVGSADPLPVATSSPVAGSSASASRQDHQHAHGNMPGVDGSNSPLHSIPSFALSSLPASPSGQYLARLSDSNKGLVSWNGARWTPVEALQAFRLEDFGGIPDDSSGGARTANNAAIVAILATMPYVDGGSGAGSTGGGRIVFGPHSYYFSGTVTITRPCSLRGVYAGFQASKSKLYFPGKGPGIIFNGFANSATFAHEVQVWDLDFQSEQTLATWAPNTAYPSGTAVVPAEWGDFVMVSRGGTSGGSQPAWPENLQTPQNPDTVAGQTVSDGTITWDVVQCPTVFSRVPTYLHNIMVQNACGSGIILFGNTSNSNVDLSTFDRVCVNANMSSGMQVFGNDGNACSFRDVFAQGNGTWGIFDEGFLGNTYYGPDCSNNGTAPWDSGFANGAIALGTRVCPSIPNGYEFKCTTGGTAGSSEPAWTTTIGTTVTDGSVVWTCVRKYSGGPWNVDGTIYNGYAEGGQLPAVMSNVTSTAMFCDNGSGYLPTQAGWVVASQTSVGPFTSKKASSDSTYDAALQVGDVQGGLLFADFLANLKDGSLHDAVQFMYNSSNGYFQFTVNNGNSVPLQLPANNSPHGPNGPVKFGNKGIAFPAYGSEIFLSASIEQNSPPTSGSWPAGSFVFNSNPIELGTNGSKYILLGWTCTVGGTPGTWLQARTLTGN
jgi:hypothetical protein